MITDQKTKKLIQVAVLTAIIALFSFTPIGYLKLGVLSITLMSIPVIVGAICIDPISGAILGAVFGATSFIQCFGADVFGTTLLGISLFKTIIVCFVPRILIGLFSGLLFKAIKRRTYNGIIAFPIAALIGSLTNTIFFLGILIILFGQSDYIKGFGDNIFTILTTLGLVNGLVEAVVVTIICTLICKPLQKALRF